MHNGAGGHVYGNLTYSEPEAHQFSNMTAKVSDEPGEQKSIPVVVLPTQVQMALPVQDNKTIVSTWRQAPEKEDTFSYVLRHFYFPIFAKYHRYIVFAWLVVFIICVVYGPAFLSSTRSNLDLPPGTPSTDAINAFQDHWPLASGWAPLFILIQAKKNQGAIGPYSKTVDEMLVNYAKTQSDAVSYVSGYWQYIQNPATRILADETVSRDNQTMFYSVGFRKDTNLERINEVADDLLKAANRYSTDDVRVGCTGIFALFHEMAIATATNMELIDATVLPVAVIILGFTLRSYRHMLVALCSLGCTLLLAFGLLVPVSNDMDINPFSPSIMLSLGIAICFDYMLFMVTRFREERIVKHKSKEDAVFGCVEYAGHVVVLSGMTLFCTFMLLISFPQNFLQSVGVTCGTVVFVAIFCNMTLPPALLLSFDCLSHFDPLPSRTSFCCYIPKEDPAVVASQREAEWLAERASRKRSLSGRLDASSGGPDGKDLESLGGGGGGGGAAVEDRAEGSKPHSLWFRTSYFLTRVPALVLLVACCISAPCIYAFLQMNASSDNYLVYLHNADSTNTLRDMRSAFSLGMLDPYQVIVVAGAKDAVNSSAYFEVESSLVQKLLATQHGFADANSFTALSFFMGQNVTYDQFLQYTDPSSAVYATPRAGAYRQKALSKPSPDWSACMVTVETLVDPDSDVIVPFINSVRKILIDLTARSPVPTFPVKAHLFGGYTTTIDVQNALYAVVPIVIGVTVAIVLVIITFSFGSIFLALRLVFTVFTSLCWTYGLMVGVYQPGPIQEGFKVLTPSLKYSSGIYWLIPVMAFSILVGLALDYDIFLMSRVVEFRMLGWSDRASVCLAVDKSGYIISAAGLIMSVSFAGLLMPDTTCLNQYGFILFIGVAIDTFIVRPVLVPAVVTLASHTGSDVNWWPRKMPEVALTPEEEERALRAGLWEPVSTHALNTCTFIICNLRAHYNI